MVLLDLLRVSLFVRFQTDYVCCGVQKPAHGQTRQFFTQLSAILATQGSDMKLIARLWKALWRKLTEDKRTPEEWERDQF